MFVPVVVVVEVAAKACRDSDRTLPPDKDAVAGLSKARSVPGSDRLPHVLGRAWASGVRCSWCMGCRSDN